MNCRVRVRVRVRVRRGSRARSSLSCAPTWSREEESMRIGRGWLGAAGLLAAGLLPASAARAPRAPAPPDAATAARRSLALIQRGAANYLTHQECFSCHHQALPLMTCSLAERCGLSVSREAV